MKFSITKEAFIEGLQQVQHVVNPRSTLPILSNVLIEASDGGLQLTTTDLDVGVRGRANADVSVAGTTTLPARKLAGIIRELPHNDVEIEVDGKNTASIRSGSSRFRIIGLDGADFPELPKFEDAKEFKLDQKALKDGLKKTSYAISTDETRYVLNGIFCTFKDNKMTLVATDGRRLAMSDLDLEFPQNFETEIIIPTKAVNELQRLLQNEGDVMMSVTDSHVKFQFGDRLLVSKLVEGNYPNFRQVVPSETRYRVALEREVFLGVVSRISLLASEKSNSVKLCFTKDNIEIMANSPDIGEAQESLAVSYNGEDVTIAFNPEFLMAPLRNLNTDEVYLELIDSMSPGVVKNDSSFLYVLMPMRVSQ
jgi:DNA polymerase III subunit beta